jgi:hypothetical protein
LMVASPLNRPIPTSDIKVINTRTKIENPQTAALA